jgi:hypothetical protein
MRAILPDAAQDAGFPFTMPAPTGGWNARDNMAKMSPLDALFLDNWFPGTTAVAIRPGSALAASLPVGKEIKTLMGLALRNGSIKRFAAAADGIYDITLGGLAPTPDSAATSAYWESVNMEVGGVSYLWACTGDGVNKSRIYNGTTDTWVVLDGASTPALTGLDSRDVANVSLFKSRLILTQRGSMSFWVGDLNSVGGAFTEFPLGAIFPKGGYLVATANWTVDAGNGVDDRFVAISSEGEIAVYQGTDPTDATQFSLVGVYEVGKPIGKRCFLKLAGDLGMLTEQGLWPISKALQSATVDTRIALTDKIQSAFNTFYKQFGAEFGWQAVLLPKGPAVIVNVPLGFGNSYQFVMNTITGAWCRFLSWNAECMMVVDGKLYFAKDNVVREGWTGRKDINSAITATVSTAFSYGPAKSRSKKISLVKPVMEATANVTLGMALDTDFNIRRAITTIASFIQNLAIWDSAVFGTSLWSGGQTMINTWKVVNHKPGKAFSLRIRVQIKDIDVSWAATDFIGETGGML